MLSMNIEVMLAQLVRQLLIAPGGREGEVLSFSFDCDMGYYEHCNDGGSVYTDRCGLHLLYYCQPEYTTVSVFSAITDSPFTKVREVKEWKHECSHDSCWRDIRVFSEVFFRMVKNINDAMVADGHPKVAGARMHEHNSFSLFSEAWTWLPALVRRDPNDNYKRIITLT